jgi:hypothetical protein
MAPWDPVLIANLIFCIIIVILSYWAYKKIKNTSMLYIGAAFGLFGISHLAVLMGYDSSLMALIIVRSLGYIMVIIALLRAGFRS